MGEKKMCPLMMAHSGFTGAGLCNCIGDLCAWYVQYASGGGCCALRDIAAELTGVGQR